MREQMIEEVVVDTVFMLFKTGCVNFCFFRGGVLIMSVIFFFFLTIMAMTMRFNRKKRITLDIRIFN